MSKQTDILSDEQVKELEVWAVKNPKVARAALCSLGTLFSTNSLVATLRHHQRQAEA